MANQDKLNDSPVPLSNNSKRQAKDLLPRFFRTAANEKFLQGTIDQLVQPGTAEKINAYAGEKYTKSKQPNDTFLPEVSKIREDYQLSPALVYEDKLKNVEYVKDYIDFIGTTEFFGGETVNHSKLNEQQSYAWNPNIDFDKFTNFREYYWLPQGPQSVDIFGQSIEIESTYTIKTVVDDDNTAYVFNGLVERNPSLSLYRGQTYKFEIDSPGHPIAFSLSRSFLPGTAIITAGKEGIKADGAFDSQVYGATNYDIGEFIVLPQSGSVTFDDAENVSTLYTDGQRKLGEEGEEITNVYIEKGTIVFTVPENAPDRLFYVSKNAEDTSGLFRIYNIEDATQINVEKEILNKKAYTSSNSVQLSNGMKVKFRGQVTPAMYGEGEWYIEGVGDAIKIVSTVDLVSAAEFYNDKNIAFDTDAFDTNPFSNALSYPESKDYIVSNRGSIDRNPWARNNRWFHKSVIEESLRLNHLPDTFDQSGRASRPIIEYDAGLKLYNYGVLAKKDVDLIDTFTTDVFSTIEGQIGYNIDGIDLAEGMRILFTADNDILVKGKIYEVKFITIGEGQNVKRQISLVAPADTNPVDLELVFVTNGLKNIGKTYHYHGDAWQVAQTKTDINQYPMFELHFENLTDAEMQNFKGTNIISYKEGTGAIDSELGIALSYKNITNSGDIQFNFNLLTDSFLVENEDPELSFTQRTDTAFLKIYKSINDFDYANGWSSDSVLTKQFVCKEYTAQPIQLNNFEISQYTNPADITDLKIKVFKNHEFKLRDVDYTITTINKAQFITFTKDCEVNDQIKISAFSNTVNANENGKYELPINYVSNPNNLDVSTFTLGEAIDHVGTTIEDIEGYNGVFPGTSNLRDLGNYSKHGKRFIKHSAPLSLAHYHLTNKKYNIIKALDYAENEYIKFKRIFIETASNLGFDGPLLTHFDKVMEALNADKITTAPFYFSDMISYVGGKKQTYEVLDARIKDYPLQNVFNLDSISTRSVYVYYEGEQLVHERDYDFSNSGFVTILKDIQAGKTIEVMEFDLSDGNFVPPTPTKLGLFPKYYPALVIDDTYQTEKAQDNVAYQIYGEVASEQKALRDVRNDPPELTEAEKVEGKKGYHWPVFKNESAAAAADSNGEVIKIYFTGMSIPVFMPKSTASFVNQISPDYEIYPNGVPFIRGHDGSMVRAYQDYRDDLLIELEKRIYNNIKIKYDTDFFDIDDYLSGAFRKNRFSYDENNSSMLASFSKWLRLVDNDYTDASFYDRNNHFTFNYSNSNAPNGDMLPGFWRGVYTYLLDTDRPHSHPWEVLGFHDKPRWWDKTYGEGPYTSDNLILWEDLQEGIVREPGKEIKIRNKYKRPGLLKSIPSDSNGNLRSPIESSTAKNFITRQATQSYKFGDIAPVENAWRKSSGYAFAVIRSMLVNNPAKTFALGFDRSRIKKNLANQIIYTQTNKPISMNSLVFPNTQKDNTRVYTSGFVNYIYNLIASDILQVYKDYQNEVTNIDTKLVLRLAGYSDTNKLNILIDSRSPTRAQQGGIYLPKENYKVVYNKSNPIQTISYSGVAIQKAPDGFIIRGYTDIQPYFEYFDKVDTNTLNSITVGGISETFSAWEAGSRYSDGQIVEFNNTYYRATKSFTAGETFDTDNLAKLPSGLPIVGGKTATIAKAFDKKVVKRLAYGEKLKTSQQVVDFLLGYDARLKELGFSFNYVSGAGQVETWRKAIEEFLFWTTQGWAAGTVITLSPSANELEFNPPTVGNVDNLYDDFYDYSIVDSAGQPLDKEFGNLVRAGNSFGLTVQETDNGIYGIILPIVQHEHIVVFDNVTSFDDIIYQPRTGYRQERLKIIGYRSDDWDASLNVPGFIFDEAKVVEWQAYKDYVIGQLVKYKEFYYVATANVPGNATFNDQNYFRLNEKPEAELLTNFDTRTNQFADFYDVDTAGYDSELQKMAHHLIGFQKREYLSNIVIDDISQYKFYQGMIQEKGTQNALTKLFSRLNTQENVDSLEFYEDWALQIGRYGASESYDQIEIDIKQENLQNTPQIVKLTNNVPPTNVEKTYYVKTSDLNDRPAHFDIDNTFEENANVNRYIDTTGNVHESDVQFIAGDKQQLTTGNVNLLKLNDYIWTQGNDSEDWNVYQHIETAAQATNGILEQVENREGNIIYTLTLDTLASTVAQKGDLVGILNAGEFLVNGIYEVSRTSLKTIDIIVNEDSDLLNFAGQKFRLTKLRSVRYEELSDIDIFGRNTFYKNQKIWINNFAGDWNVLRHNEIWSKKQEVKNHLPDTGDYENFARYVVADRDNRNVFVSAEGQGNGQVNFYKRTKENFDLTLDQEITFDEEYLDTTSTDFGASIDVSPDGEYLAVGMPGASAVKTRYKDTFDETATYTKNDIVKYREQLWQAVRQINPRVDQQAFTTFDSYSLMISRSDTDSTDLNLLLAGNPGLNNTTVDHILVRAPFDMYIGTVAGDRINLAWNSNSFAYPTLDTFTPFNGDIPYITKELITSEFEIQAKIDHVLLIETFVALPTVGQRVTTDTGSGTVYYVDTSGDSAIIYITDVNGELSARGELFIEELDFVGFYDETNTLSTSDAIGGYFFLNTPLSYSNGNNQIDKGQGLVYADIRQAGETDPVNDYYNIQDTVAEVGPYVTQKNNASFVTHLSYRGDPGGTVEGPQLSKFYLVKLPKVFSDAYYAENFDGNGDIITDPRAYELRFFQHATSADLIAKGFSTKELMNKSVQAYDLWDGYIDFTFDNFDFSGNAFEPVAKYVEDSSGNLTINPNGGDIIEDIQTPRDGLGGLALTTQSTSTAEVMYFRRQFNTVRVYIKIKTGTWEELNNIGRYQIRRTSNETLRSPGDVNITMGTVADFDNDVIVERDPIGKLMVLRAENNFDIVDDPEIKDNEYYFFNEETILTGASRPANPPYSTNKDYRKLYHLPADPAGTEGPSEEGAVAIYRRLPQGTYALSKFFVSEYRTAGRRFGSQVKFVQQDNYYTLVVGTKPIPGEDDLINQFAERDNPGSLEFYRHGTLPTDAFKGEFKLTTYERGDIVIYKDDYYRANKDVSSALANSNTILNNIFWTNISWKSGKDENYQGEWENSYPYALGDIVHNQGQLYKAKTNLSAGQAFSTNAWANIESNIDYVGLIPNRSGLTFYTDETIYDPQANILNFASSFDISDNGQVMAIIAKQSYADSTANSVLLIYRQTDDKFMLHQTIEAPSTETIFNPFLQEIVESSRYRGYYGALTEEDSSFDASVTEGLSIAYEAGDIVQYKRSYYKSKQNMVIGDVMRTSAFGDSAGAYEVAFDITKWEIIPKELRVVSGEWGSAISISPDGDTVAVVAPSDDTFGANQGVVYIYELSNGTFAQSQVIRAPGNEESEGFGTDVSITDNSLAVSSRNGDQIISTTFDESATVFDSKFTVFNNVKLDTGVVTVYEKVNDTFIYSEQLQFKNAQTAFGEVLNNNNNHIYVSMPDYQNSDLSFGIFLDYRKPKNTVSWSDLRSKSGQVDLNKIQGIVLYNKREHRIETYIDYIDPVQGKIAGPADQEIKYRNRTDPALYNVGALNNLRVNTSQFWGEEHVGEVWWDISKARFTEPYQDSDIWQSDNTNTLSQVSSIQLYEWVESNFLPAQWNELSGTADGLALGITGNAPFGDTQYSSSLVYDQVAQNFSNKYYFWVQNKTTIPNVSFRKIRLDDIKNLIAAPRENGYRYISFLNKNTLLLNNFKQLITNDDMTLQIRYKNIEDQDQNRHTQYQIVSEGLVRDGLNVDIERKWFDSLVGIDYNGKKVPDTNIPMNHRYGVQNNPRQSMFKNRNEAVKQVIERINSVVENYTIVDNFDISPLNKSQPAPTIQSRIYDLAIDTYEDLTFVSTNKVTQAKLSPVITNGRIVAVNVTESGRGYKTAPTVEIVGSGTNAEIRTEINNLGQVTGATIVNNGEGYLQSTTLFVRRFTVLIRSDASNFNKWALYTYNEIDKRWFVSKTQDYDVSSFYETIDWYAEGYNQFTKVDNVIKGTYEFGSITDWIGQTVKVENIGSGGWTLFEKIDSQDTNDFTVNYKTIGRENGTIKFKDTLYNVGSRVGFDSRSFDTYFFDNIPQTELRLILETVRDNIFIGDLKNEYNKLFFASVRYAIAEQIDIDWVFKTSFVSATHNLGGLKKTPTFKNDNLDDYESYVQEVKPYKTNIREYVSKYTEVEPTNSAMSDFDLPPEYNTFDKKIMPSRASIIDGVVQDGEDNLQQYPRKFWTDNNGFKVVKIEIKNGGSGYVTKPKVMIESATGTGAAAEASIGYGKVTGITVTYKGDGYKSPPTVSFMGGNGDGENATAYAILGEGVVRTPHIRVKFDRTDFNYYFSTLQHTETFTGTQFETRFDLKWPMDTQKTKVIVKLNGVEQLRSKYTFENITNTTAGYTREQGRITFTTPPALNDVISVEYYKSQDLLKATDRIQFAYDPLTEMYGKDLAQLMTGIDYGGVEVKSYGFEGISGWMNDAYFVDSWDNFDNTYEDEVFTADGSTIAVQLSQPLADNVDYNIYKNGVRIDAPDFVNGSSPTNVNAVCKGPRGDGSTQVIYLDELNIELLDGDVLIVRKITSDGSILPDSQSFDTQLKGGDLPYNSAKGVDAGEIIVDGSGFIDPKNIGPEEFVPGTVLDTLDIKVYTNKSKGQGRIFSQSYLMDSTNTFSLGVVPATIDNVIVKANNIILPATDYTFDYTVTPPTITIDSSKIVAGQELNIISQEAGVQNIITFGTFTTDGSTTAYDTGITYNSHYTVFATLNGVVEPDVTTVDTNGILYIALPEETAQDHKLSYIVFSNDTEVNYSQAKIDNFVAGASQTTYTLPQAPFYAPPAQHNTIVKVDNVILNPGYNIQYTIPANNQREYVLETFQQPPGSNAAEDLKVFINGEEIFTPIQWRFDVANSSIVLSDEYGIPGDIIEIFVITDGEYIYNGANLILNTAPTEGQSVSVYQYSNHNIVGIERINYDVIKRDTILPNTVDYQKYNRLTDGEVPLRGKAVDAQYVFVSINGELLTPSVDFSLHEDRDKIQIARPVSQNDVIDIMHFSSDVSVTNFAFRQFKDLLNRTHYKRLDAAVATLTQPLGLTDLRIYCDTSHLPTPSKEKNVPGVVFIDQERIEYFVKEDGMIRQLRRGTLGTGAKAHPVGSEVFDQSIGKTIPYKDVTFENRFTTDGITNDFDLTFNIESINEIEVFVAGKRLRKADIQVYNPELAMDSPAGDETIPAEFSVNTTLNTVTINTLPAEGQRVIVIKKTLTEWSASGEQLGLAENSVARFLRAGAY